jgi:hypothetical protein
MWWLLLIALEGGEYRSEIIVQTVQQCESLKTQDEDLCVAVEVRFLEMGTAL